MGHITTVSPTAIDLADEAFRALCEGSPALTLDVRDVAPDLACGPVRLDELQRLLLAGASQITRDAVWAEVVRRARREETWKLVAIGMAVPALRTAAGSLARGFGGDVEELDAEILAGFLTHLDVVDISLPGIVTKLRWAAWRAGREVVLDHRKAAERGELAEDAAALARPSGHPDLVLIRAVEAGAISATDADLITATRLENEDMETYAERCGASYNAVKIRRQRAESRLVAYVTGTRRPRADEARVRSLRPAQRVAMGRSDELLVAA